jgi:hypothetical protein
MPEDPETGYYTYERGEGDASDQGEMEYQGEDPAEATNSYEQEDVTYEQPIPIGPFLYKKNGKTVALKCDSSGQWRCVRVPKIFGLL